MTTPPVSPLATPVPWDLVAADYSLEVRPLFEPFAARALELAGVEPGSRIADIACGPGTLSTLAAARGAHVSALDFSPEMIRAFEARIAQGGLRDIEPRVGDGMALPYADGAFDAAFSMFGLMFFPDRAKGLRELHRVLRPGARAVISSWRPMDTVPLMATVFGVIAERHPSPVPQVPPALSSPEACLEEMAAAGFRDVQVVDVEQSMDVPEVSVAWESLQRTMAPVALLKSRLPPEVWIETSSAILRALIARFGREPVSTPLRALLTVGARGRT